VLAPVEVELVAQSIAVTELDIRETAQLRAFLLVFLILRTQFTRASFVFGCGRNEIEQRGCNAIAAAGNPSVAGTVAAFVGAELHRGRGCQVGLQNFPLSMSRRYT